MKLREALNIISADRYIQINVGYGTSDRADCNMEFFQIDVDERDRFIRNRAKYLDAEVICIDYTIEEDMIERYGVDGASQMEIYINYKRGE